MKVAVITDDGTTISQHFGRAEYYLVFTIEDGEVTEREMRSKLGHHHFSDEQHDHEHDPRGHGFGEHAASRHDRMMQAIQDCEALIVRGMGRGAYMALAEANIKPVVTDFQLAEDAVKAYIEGSLADLTDKLH